MVDGNCSVDELRELELAGNLNQALGLLEENTYIEPIRQPEAAAPASKVDESAQKELIFRKISVTSDLKEIEMAKHFILNTLYTFCGQHRETNDRHQERQSCQWQRRRDARRDGAGQRAGDPGYRRIRF
jgi:hypothetical protein